MIALSLKLKNLRDAFVSVLQKTYHYERPARTKAPFAVWKEDHEDMSIETDNRKAEQGVEGYLDYYTLKEFDPIADAFQECLNTSDDVKFWNLDSVDKEDETGLIHYRWSWRV